MPTDGHRLPAAATPRPGGGRPSVSARATTRPISGERATTITCPGAEPDPAGALRAQIDGPLRVALEIDRRPDTAGAQ
jgi:hypothetical protein